MNGWVFQNVSIAVCIASMLGKYLVLVTAFFVIFQHSSMAASSGEYGGRYSTFIHCLFSSRTFFTVLVLCQLALSRIRRYCFLRLSFLNRDCKNKQNVSVF